jgi:hypothetical protein
MKMQIPWRGFGLKGFEQAMTIRITDATADTETGYVATELHFVDSLSLCKWITLIVLNWEHMFSVPGTNTVEYTRNNSLMLQAIYITLNLRRADNFILIYIHLYTKNQTSIESWTEFGLKEEHQIKSIHIKLYSLERSYIMNVAIFWGRRRVNPYVNQRFGGTYHLHLQDWKSAEQETSVQQVPRHLGSHADYSALYPRTWQQVILVGAVVMNLELSSYITPSAEVR